MNKIPQLLENQLLELIDGNLSASEKEKIEQEIEHSPEVKKRYNQLVEIDRALKTIQLEQPSKTFTQIVMAKLNSQPLQTGFSIKNGLLLLFGVLIAVGAATVLLATGVFDTAGTIDLNNIVAPNLTKEPLPSVPFNGKLVVNGIIILNIVLAFLILDRTILKPWFNRRINDMQF
ncbi:MAG: hypothetical protein KF687_14805 [Cyclobacteriaceae bacterium]|nr:hypothetical protein [Cyclobacteriaceae bacterium]